jgi:orotidine-5'-phosphate decarboxylase
MASCADQALETRVMTPNDREPRIIVALDYAAADPALELVQRLEPGACRLKVGKEMFTRFGPEFVAKLTNQGFDVFLDLKFHDIPNTVAAACAAAADLGVWMVNVHASGGRRMMEAARRRLDDHPQRPLLVAVTILTSLAAEDIAEVGFQGSPEDNVLRLARLAQASGADGVVCSAREASLLRSRTGGPFLLVTPGIRPAAASRGDQQRITTPADALRAGADFLVVGRPITQAGDPLQALAEIQREIAEVPQR